MERLSGKVEKVTFIKNVGLNLDLCEIEVGFDILKIFDSYNELLKFVGVEILYTIRRDMIDGKEEYVMCDPTVISTIQVLPTIQNIKLVPEGNRRTVCNFAFSDLQMGGYYYSLSAILSSIEFGSTKKAMWYDCLMIDNTSKEFYVRIFSTNTSIDELKEFLEEACGKYVQFDANFTKYGLQTDKLEILPNSVEQSPEVLVAQGIIRDIISKDEALKEYDTKFDFVNKLLDIIDGEPGYTLVRIASEIYMINAIDSISTELDITSMKRASLCSYGYMIPSKVDWSITRMNTTRAQSVSKLKEDRELMLILDVLSREEFSPTKKTYIKIKGLVNDIISIRRGVVDEKGNIVINDVRSLFNGLL